MGYYKYTPALSYIGSIAHVLGEYVFIKSEPCRGDVKELCGEITEITSERVSVVAGENEKRAADGTILIKEIAEIARVYRPCERSRAAHSAWDGIGQIHCKDDFSNCW